MMYISPTSIGRQSRLTFHSPFRAEQASTFGPEREGFRRSTQSRNIYGAETSTRDHQAVGTIQMRRVARTYKTSCFRNKCPIRAILMRQTPGSTSRGLPLPDHDGLTERMWHLTARLPYSLHSLKDWCGLPQNVRRLSIYGPQTRLG